MSPREVDELEIWEVASIFGLADPPDEEEKPETPQKARPTRSKASGRAMLKARVKAAQDGGPAPRWGPPSTAEHSALAPLLSYGGAVET